MYPAGELRRLAARKALLQARVAVRRLECQLHAQRVARPLRMVDGLWAKWRAIAPLAKLVGVPVGLWAAGKFFRGGGLAGKAGGWLKFAPLALRAVRAFAQAREHARAR